MACPPFVACNCSIHPIVQNVAAASLTAHNSTLAVVQSSELIFLTGLRFARCFEHMNGLIFFGVKQNPIQRARIIFGVGTALRSQPPTRFFLPVARPPVSMSQFGGEQWPGGIERCPNTMPQAWL